MSEPEFHCKRCGRRQVENLGGAICEECETALLRFEAEAADTLPPTALGVAS